MTALVVSHDPRSAAIADRVVHIRDGRVSEERHGEGAAVVIGRGGWLRLPEEALLEAGIVDRATVTARDGVVELRPLGALRESPLMLPGLEGAAGVVVELRGVSRRFGRDVALDELSARFAPGRLSVVTGPSGSGKSTLLALVAGLDVPDERRGRDRRARRVGARPRGAGPVPSRHGRLHRPVAGPVGLPDRARERRARARDPRRRGARRTRARDRRARRRRSRRAGGPARGAPLGRAARAGRRRAGPRGAHAGDHRRRADLAGRRRGGAHARGPLRGHRARARHDLRLRHARPGPDRLRRRRGAAARGAPVPSG